ncbi:MAG: ubiquitin-like small modifier protein 1 [Candidatus Bathyarchaeia archaeon]
MLHLHVNFYAYMRELTHVNKLELEISKEATVKDLLDQLVERFGRKFRERVLEPNGKELRRGIAILVNGRNIEALQRLETKLVDGDIVAVVPPVAGGQNSPRI